MPADYKPEIYALLTAQRGALNRAAIDAGLYVAGQSGATCAAIVIGASDAHTLAEVCAGVDTVWHLALAEGAQTHQMVAALADALSGQHIAWDADTLFITEPDGAAAETAIRIAARLGGTALGRCEAIQRPGGAELTLEKSAFGGRLHTTLHAQEGPYFLSMRTPVPASASSQGASASPQGAVPASAEDAASSACRITEVTRSSPLPPPFACEQNASGEQTVSLEGARIIVSGGRGMGGEEGFAALQVLAGSIGAAVGASLPAVDAGWAPVARQIGQSGKYVSPEVYLGVGVSGTPQHLAGIDPHTRIVAVNKDPEAGIFARARVGVVADWREFLPELAKALAAQS